MEYGSMRRLKRIVFCSKGFCDFCRLLNTIANKIGETGVMSPYHKIDNVYLY